ncbi:hypothetical protein [Wenzhouxiangella sp. EGI_FJ10305]|uniref:hypothetical protein n=1 Tax=Wenzhouxiangella sp. EGI_FJ10305 TaxID=3243768 RepID=UPI0035DD7D1B
MNTWRHSRRSNTLLSVAIGLVMIGLLAVGVYAFNVLAVLDQADQSMVFWLLPFLLFGLAAVGNGVVLAVLWLLLVSTEGPGNKGDGPGASGPREE